MAYQAIYRKWRPAVFEDIVGQGHITGTLRNQITSGQVSHAYLFCGTRGTGKTTAAKVFSRAVNCLNPNNGSPCNECEICKGILDGSVTDVTEIDAASNNGVDNIRELRDDVNYVALRAKYRVYIIDEVHMLSDGAFNALLKTLEEPPSHVLFILATTAPHKVPETILSRCQRFDFKRIRTADIITRMKEIAYGDGLQITDDAYMLLAKLADGSMRDGLSILERCVSACGESITVEDITSVLGIADTDADFKAADAIANGSAAEVLSLVNTLVSDGKDLNLFIDSLISHFHDIMIAKLSDKPEDIIETSSENLLKIKHQAEKLSFETLSRAADILNNARADAKWVKSPRMIYELALIKLTRPMLDDSKEALQERIAKLEEEVKNGIKVSVSSTSEAEKVQEKPKKKEPSSRLYVPLDVSSLTTDTPVVVAARKWDVIAGKIARKTPYLAGSVVNRKITIDGEGIILLFDTNERMRKEIAATYISMIRDAVEKETGRDFVVKTAYTEDLEDNIVDYWNVAKGNSSEESHSETTQNISEDNIESDPMDRISNNFPEIVEVTDQSEFLDYQPGEESFEQSEFEDDREEFFTDEEQSELDGE
ncbi:MAG: DNA polymerase III subunit gamma/tau [Eubacteriales bacterium]|nr:DNA polymerase III subunit gamma/tau [Eubacteriales bacterium]